MNAKILESLTAASFLLAGVRAAHAADLHSASTPDRTPMVTTPFAATPKVGTPAVTTPSESAAATVQSIQLPTGATVSLGALTEDDLSTPRATPEVKAAPVVPSVSVASIEVPSITVNGIPVQVALPAAAVAGTDGVHAWTTGLPASIDLRQGSEGAATHVGSVSASIGLGG